jgi:hypothetical protein
MSTTEVAALAASSATVANAGGSVKPGIIDVQDGEVQKFPLPTSRIRARIGTLLSDLAELTQASANGQGPAELFDIPVPLAAAVPPRRALCGGSYWINFVAPPGLFV